MSKIAYIEKRFSRRNLGIIEQANQIIQEYQAQGYDLTLRQAYYKFVARDLFPDDMTWTWTGSKWVRDPNGTKNAEPNYKFLGSLLNDGRLAGLIDWEAIVDRTRELKVSPHWKQPGEIIESAAQQYQIDKWLTQPVRVEVFIEKDALTGIFDRICRRSDLDVPYFICRGYTSQSEMWAAGQRYLNYREKFDQDVVVLHFGDHDPSGIDMTRDIRERLDMFVEGGVDVEIKRLALNGNQIREYKCPPNPAKLTDSRARSYVEVYGNESWELDALEPKVISDLVETAVKEIRDENTWEKEAAEERKHLKELQRIVKKLKEK